MNLNFYETPSWCTEALIEREEFKGYIWEPACGYGAISKVLKDNGHEVYSSDIEYRGYGFGVHDFLVDDPPKLPTDLRSIVTNPPFNKAEEFVKQAFKLSNEKVCMLLRLAFLESQVRQKLFAETPLKKVWVSSKRVTMYPADYIGEMKNGGTMAMAWFVWEHGYKGQPTIGWF